MPSIFNNLGTKLFQSVSDKAGDIGDRFEEEFSQLSSNITSQVDVVVEEMLSLSIYVKVTLALLCVLIVVAILRYLAFGGRAAFFKARDWLRENSEKQPPQVILLMPQNGEGDNEASSTTCASSPNGEKVAMRPPMRISTTRSSGRQTTTFYADPITSQNIENIKRESLALFHHNQKIDGFP